VDWTQLQSTFELGAGRTVSLVELLEGWAAHVVRLRTESLLPIQDDAWGMHDLVAALFIRDGLERALAGGPVSGSAIVAAVDDLYRSFTVVDELQLMHLIEPSAKHAGWWWGRIPSSGVVADELRALANDWPD
jgi:hypothetical protein